MMTFVFLNTFCHPAHGAAACHGKNLYFIIKETFPGQIKVKRNPFISWVNNYILNISTDAHKSVRTSKLQIL